VSGDNDKPLVAYHGENWESPRFFVAIGGARPSPPLSEWYMRAQVREHSRATAPTFEWNAGNDRVVFGSGVIELSDGTELETDWFQLVMLPADWAGKPYDWTGLLEVEISSDASDAPLQRRTIVRRRPFKVEGDVAR
jgi:hypothetical protein